MSNKSRRKGKLGELEFAGWLRTRFPRLTVQRNYAQSAVGGYDLTGLPGVALEIKRRKTGTQHSASWWKQVCSAAQAESLIPMLAFRFDGNTDWSMVVPLDWVLKNPIKNPEHRYACLPAYDWAALAEDRIDEESENSRSVPEEEIPEPQGRKKTADAGDRVGDHCG